MVPVIWNQFFIEKLCWERESCLLSGIEKRPFLGGYVSIKVMLDTICNTMVRPSSGSVIGGSTLYPPCSPPMR